MEADPQSKFTGDLKLVYAIPNTWHVTNLHLEARKTLKLEETDTVFLMTRNSIPSITVLVKDVHAVS